MNLPILLALVALTVAADPSGDAFGDGTLTPPTAPVYANTAVFDLQSVALDADEDGARTRVAVTLGSLGLSAEAAAEDDPGVTPPATVDQEEGEETPLTSFLPAVIDVYLGGTRGGSDRTLPGPDLLFPEGTGWEYAVRITSAGAFYIAYPQTQDEQQAEPVDVLSLPRVELDVFTIGNTLVVYLPVTLTSDTLVHAMTGVFDPFSASGWRGLSETPSPWQYSGATSQQSPVVDLIARNAEAQRAALSAGVLPRADNAPTVLAVPWLWVMGAGLLVAGIGLVMRGRVRKHEPEGAAAPADAEGAPAPETSPLPEPEDGVVVEEIAGDEADAASQEQREPDSDEPTDVLLETEAATGAAAAVEPEESEENPAPIQLQEPDETPTLVQGDEADETPTLVQGDEPDETPTLVQGDEPDETPTLVQVEEAEETPALAQAEEPEATSAPLRLTEPEEGPVHAQAEEPDVTPAPMQLEDSDEAPASEQPEDANEVVGTGAGADPFGTAVEDSFLMSLDDPRAIQDFLGEDDTEESFWHPRARKAPADATDTTEAAPQTTGLPTSAQNEDSGAD